MAKTKAEIFVPYPRPRRLLSVDPGERAGLSIFRFDDEVGFILDSCWEVNGDSTRAIADTVRGYKARSTVPSIVVIERQFMKKREGGKVQISGFETLLRRRMAWETIAEVFGLPTALIYPVSWQSKYLAKKTEDDESTKDRAKRTCLKLWPERSKIWELYENACDSALLGRFYADRVQERIF